MRENEMKPQWYKMSLRKFNSTNQVLFYEIYSNDVLSLRKNKRIAKIKFITISKISVLFFFFFLTSR